LFFVDFGILLVLFFIKMTYLLIWILYFVIERHCCPKRFLSITNFIDFTGLKGYKNAFCDFDPSFI